jgi:aminoglycoside 6'-N-acetyltransferase Ib
VALRFERLTEANLPMLAEWLNRPHVAEWWADCQTLAEVREQYLPILTDGSTVLSYFAYLESFPIGYIQSYVAADAGDGWWPDEHDPGVRGIDQFLADADSLGRGLGTQMVREFVQFLFEDSTVTRIQADPAPSNLRAIRCYEKAGFRRVGVVSTPDGAAMLMVIERPSKVVLSDRS